MRRPALAALVARSAVVDARNVHAATPLYLAAQAGHERVVRVLLAPSAASRAS